MLSSISATRGVVLRQDAPRKVRRDRQHAVDAAVAQIGERLRPESLYSIVSKVARAGGDGVGQLAHSHRRHAVVLIDDADLQVLDVAAERVAEDDELHEREDQRDDDERRAAPEPPQLAFDDGPGSMHITPAAS